MPTSAFALPSTRRSDCPAVASVTMFASGSNAFVLAVLGIDAAAYGPLYGTYGPYTSAVLAGITAEGFATGVDGTGAKSTASAVIGVGSGRDTPLRPSDAEEFCARPAVAVSIHTAAQTNP